MKNKYRPLKIKKLFELKHGDKYIVYWAKDDDPINQLRLNYKVQTILENDGKRIITTDTYDWEISECPDLEGNMLDTGRGYAYFYKTVKS